MTTNRQDHRTARRRAEIKRDFLSYITLLLLITTAIIYAFQYGVMKEQARIMSEQEKRQLQAYVGYSDFTISQSDAVSAGFDLTLKNYGVTPASHLKIILSSGIVPWRLDNTYVGIAAKQDILSQDGAVLLQPSEKISIFTVKYPAELEPLKSKDMVLVIEGTIEYMDIFGVRHHSPVCVTASYDEVQKNVETKDDRPGGDCDSGAEAN